MASIFSKIIAGDIPSYKIAEDEAYYAFLDIRPMAKGHTLVVPKSEVDVFFDLDESTLAGIMPFCQSVAKAIRQVIPCNRVGVSVIGLEVPHAHVHLIPIKRMKDMSFEKEPVDLSPDEMASLAKEIHAAWSNQIR